MTELKKFGFRKMNTIATKATKQYITNRNLNKKLTIYNEYNDLTKNIIKEIFSEKNNLSSQFSEYYSDVKVRCDKLKNDYNNFLSKFNNLFDECRSDITMGKPNLTEKKSLEFSLNYLNVEKNNTIKSLKDSIQSSKNYNLFREQKRDNLIDIAKGNIIVEKVNSNFQKKMLNQCKNFNKYINLIKKRKRKIISISKNIKLLDNYVKTNELKLNDEIVASKIKKIYKEEEDKPNLIVSVPSRKLPKKHKEEQKNEYSDDDKEVKKPKKPKNKIILDFIKVENLFDVSHEEGEEEKIIDNELHSDDENIFDNKLKAKSQLSTKYLNDIKKKIPSFNFKQIEFNRNKAKEIDIYSLQRRDYKKNTIDIQIKEMEKNIEEMKNKLSYLKQKEKIMKEFIKKLEDNYESIKPMIYQKSEDNIVQEENDFIVKSLNKKEEKEREKDKNIQDFLDNIEEIEEPYEEKEKSDNDIKETKETKETKDSKENKKEEEKDEKKAEKNFGFKTIKSQNINENVNLNLNKSNKSFRKTLLINIQKSHLKKRKKTLPRAKSK